MDVAIAATVFVDPFVHAAPSLSSRSHVSSMFG